MNWKVARDYFYRDLPEAQLEEAGFFEDKSKENIDILSTLDVMSTPLHFIKDNLINSKRPAVVVACGCFAPFHSGHLGAINAARKTLLANGFDKVFGYVAPDHDSYINTKVNDNSQVIDARIEVIHEAIKDIDWLRIDLWPAIFCEVAVNFTDVVHRLQSYICKHIGDIPVFLIVGGDNARFALAFQRRGGCVIVSRPGYEDRAAKYSYLVDNERIFSVLADNASSSTELRLRQISVRAKRDLILRVNEENPEEFDVIPRLSPFYKSIKIVSVQSQRENTISFDPLIKGSYNLELSRVYDFMGMNKLGFVERPGAASFEEQISEIPKGSYYLYDDDVCSGNTMRFATKLLENAGLEILDHFSFVWGEENEVLDARDFLVGAKDAGLVIKDANGKLERLPYYLPFVLPSLRASVLDSVAFSSACKRD